MFTCYAALQIILAALTLTLDLSFKLPSENIFKNLKQVLPRPQVLVLFGTQVCLGKPFNTN